MHDHAKKLQKARRKRSLPSLGKWFGVEPFSSAQESVGIVRANYDSQLFPESRHWPQNKFYITRFHWDGST